MILLEQKDRQSKIKQELLKKEYKKVAILCMIICNKTYYYDEITNRNNQLLTSLVNSNQADYSIVETVSNLLIDKNKSQFSLKPITHGNGNPKLFTINPSSPQHVIIKGSTMTFENGDSYNLNDRDPQYFITNTKFDIEINN